MKESEKAQSEGKIKKEELSIPDDRKQEKKPQEEKNQEEKIQEEKIPEKKIQDDKIREIPAKAYAENRELTGIVIPEGVEIIGEKAFYFCTGLKTVTFPKSLREIRGEAFSNCRSLKEIVIPDGVSVMEPEAFSWCEGLERVRLPESLAWLEKRVFLNCSNLKEVWIPSGVKMIGQEAFWGCTRLCRIRLPERTVWVLPSAFDKCGQLPGKFLWRYRKTAGTIRRLIPEEKRDSPLADFPFMWKNSRIFREPAEVSGWGNSGMRGRRNCCSIKRERWHRRWSSEEIFMEGGF
ncbi:MAG: leucine-rich repeat protein [Lachnospiraceae bacterium]